jgi:hypothetical protein
LLHLPRQPEQRLASCIFLGDRREWHRCGQRAEEQSESSSLPKKSRWMSCLTMERPPLELEKYALNRVGELLISPTNHGASSIMAIEWPRHINVVRGLWQFCITAAWIGSS